MRDILLTAVVLGLLPLALRRPMYGALMWAWISIMVPHQLTYGFARAVPWAMMIAIATMLGFVFSRERHRLPLNGGTVLLLLLIAWMTVTSFFALHPDSSVVWDRWVFAMKILVMVLITLMLLRGEQQIRWLLWVVVLSLAYYGAKGGLWTVLTGGSGRVWGPPGGLMEGNNELAVGLIIITPWVYYLRATDHRLWVRHSLLAVMVLLAFGILGTQSRGALVALLAMGFVLGLKGRYPVRTSIVLALLGVLLIAFMPDTWSDRMGTIRSFREEDSALSRIWTWTTLWNAAVDRPLIGAGFSADNPLVFQMYGQIPGYEYFWGRVYVAHSIYFQALGEHGFPGLVLYVSLWVWCWFAASSLIRSTRNDPAFSHWVPLLMRMSQVSLVGFAAGGAFLSLMLLDLSYYIFTIVVLTQATVREQRRSAASAVPAAPVAKPAPTQPGVPHVVTRHPIA